MDRRGSGIFAGAKGILCGLFGGVSQSVLKMASGTLQIVPEFLRHPVDTTKNMVRALPEGIKQMGDGVVNGANLLSEGRLAEGTLILTGSVFDIGATLAGGAGAVKGVATLVQKSTRVALREVEAGAAAVRNGMHGGDGAMATAGGVYMSADAAVATRVAVAPMSGPGFLGGLFAMSMADDAAAGGAAELGSEKAPLSQAALEAKLLELDRDIARASYTAEAPPGYMSPEVAGAITKYLRGAIARRAVLRAAWVDNIRAQLKVYGDQHGLRGLEGRVQRGLDAAGMLAVQETRLKLEAIARKLGTDMGRVEKLTHELHTGGIWENAERLAAASDPEVQVWMIASDLVIEGEKDAAKFLADYQWVKAGLDLVLDDPYKAAKTAKSRMVTTAQGKFILDGGIAVSESDAFVEMAICGHKTGIVREGNTLYVGAQELDYSVLKQKGLKPELRMDRGRESTFYVDAQGNPKVKKLYDGFAIVLDGDMNVARELAWTAVKTNFDEAVMQAFKIKPLEWASGMPAARTSDVVNLTPGLEKKLSGLMGDSLEGGSFDTSMMKKTVAVIDPAGDGSIVSVTVRI